MIFICTESKLHAHLFEWPPRTLTFDMKQSMCGAANKTSTNSGSSKKNIQKWLRERIWKKKNETIDKILPITLFVTCLSAVVSIWAFLSCARVYLEMRDDHVWSACVYFLAALKMTEWNDIIRHGEVKQCKNSRQGDDSLISTEFKRTNLLL